MELVRLESGRMTRAMRAVSAPAAPRALRVAVVVGGRVVEERLFRERRSIREVFGEGVRFVVDGGAFVLCAPSGVVGHVVTAAGRFSIAPRVVLDDSSRGKVVTGRATVLFQLVVAPPRPSTPKLPLAAKQNGIDWALTVIAAFSFLVHFGLVGAMFSDWLDPVVGSEADVVRLVDETRAAEPAVVEEPSAPGAAHTGRAPAAAGKGSEAPRHATVDHAASLAREAEAMKLELLGALGSGTAVEGALRRGEVPVGDLEAVARDERGATSGELALAGGGLLAPGDHALSRLGETHGEMHDGKARDPQGPKVEITITPPTGPEAPPGLEPPIARLRPSFRACYVRRGLSVDPNMEGKVTIDIAIAPNGDVADATKVSGAGLSAAVESCILERTRNASFPAVGGTGAHVRIPIIFRRQP